MSNENELTDARAVKVEIKAQISKSFRGVIPALSSRETLAKLRGRSEKLEPYLSLIGSECLAPILAEGLPEVFERSPTLLARAREVLDEQGYFTVANNDNTTLQMAADLL